MAQLTDPSIIFGTGESGRETTEFVTALNKWEKDRRFVVSRVLKDEKDRAQLSFLEGEEYDYFFFVTTQNNRQKKWLISMKNAGIVRITSRKPSVT